MKFKTKVYLSAAALVVLMSIFLVATKSYFNNKEINVASDQCYEKGGQPNVSMTALTLNYSFSCENEQ